MLLFSHRRFLDGVKTAGKVNISIAQLKTLATAQGNDHIVSFLDKASLQEQVEVKAYLKQSAPNKRKNIPSKLPYAQVGERDFQGMTQVSVYVNDERVKSIKTDDVDGLVEGYKIDYPLAGVEYADGILTITPVDKKQEAQIFYDIAGIFIEVPASKKKAALIFGEDRKAIADNKGNAFGLEGKDRTIASEDQKKLYTPKPVESTADNEERRSFRGRQKIETWHPETSDVKAAVDAVSEALKEKPDFPEILNRAEKDPVGERDAKSAKETKASVKTAGEETDIYYLWERLSGYYGGAKAIMSESVYSGIADGNSSGFNKSSAMDLRNDLREVRGYSSDMLNILEEAIEKSTASVKTSAINVEINPRDVGGFELKINGESITLADSFDDAIRALNRDFERYPNKYSKIAKEASLKTASEPDVQKAFFDGIDAILEKYVKDKDAKRDLAMELKNFLTDILQGEISRRIKGNKKVADSKIPAEFDYDVDIAQELVDRGADVREAADKRDAQAAIDAAAIEYLQNESQLLKDNIEIAKPFAVKDLARFWKGEDSLRASKKTAGDDITYSAEELGESYLNGNISHVKEIINNDARKLAEVEEWFEEMGQNKEVRRFRQLMTRSVKSHMKDRAAIEPAAAPATIATPATGIDSSTSTPQNLDKEAVLSTEILRIEREKEKRLEDAKKKNKEQATAARKVNAEDATLQLGQPITIKDQSGADKRVIPTAVDPNTKAITMVPEGTDVTTIQQQ